MKLLLNQWLCFLKAQVSAFFGGGVDYVTMIVFTEFYHVHYSLSIVIGAITGAVVNFLMNKAWAFRNKNTPYLYSGAKQILIFIFVVATSIFLKTAGTIIITEVAKINYIISRLITDLFVSIGFNYSLQSRWVFRKVNNHRDQM